jgi:hypothetical protein
MMAEISRRVETQDGANLHTHIRLKLAALGRSLPTEGENDHVLEIARDLVESYKEKSRLLADYLPPADYRIQRFLERYLAASPGTLVPRLPGDTFVLDRPGLARHLSLPAHSDSFRNEYLASYRVRNGVLHNPKHDRRTTAGSFHIAEGGLPIPGDKKAVPAPVFASLLHAALNPPRELMRPPYTLHQPEPPELFVSLLLRPVVRPAVPGFEPQKTMEIRFFAPGSLVSNLDFVERIFGNAGDPNLAENDAGLDVDHWTGHTGCIILAPHLPKLTKRELGLPHWDEASERQRREGMCWRDPAERYNDGNPFKITARDATGVIVTILGDNYFGYSKKEIKTQIGFAANLFGDAEEEHSGGALAFVRYNHGEDFGVDPRTRNLDWRFDDVLEQYGDRLVLQPEGHAVDRTYANLVYVPEGLCIDLHEQVVKWQRNGVERTIRLRPGVVYMHPSGYKVTMERHPEAPSWRLVGTEAEGTFCHKPYTVSGGGKSEIAKSIEDTVIYGSIYVQDLEQDLHQVDAIFRRDYSTALKPEFRGSEGERAGRPILSPLRSLGSVIRLFTPSAERYTHAHNEWLRTVPDHIRALVFIIKRFYRVEWGDDWRRHFSVDIINGKPGHELKFDGRKLKVGYLRVGFDADGAWRVFKLRQDFVPAAKIQMEDDISASAIVPRDRIANSPPWNRYPSAKLVTNCERYLFQRPDEAIHRGHDRLTEADLAGPDNFLSNFQPLEHREVGQLLEDVVGFEAFTAPMQHHLRVAFEGGDRFTVASSEPRRVDGKPSKNPRYLQIRDDARDPFPVYVAEMGARLHRRVPADAPLVWPVDAILMGRRNNPPERGHRPLCVYNPIHYQELPELFMDLIASVTGKSPSTTGAGSEGALTKGPFNALRTTADLNAALVGLILTGYPVFSSAAGHVGPHGRMDHDVSLLVPEIWSRLPREYRDPKRLIEAGMLEKVEDFEFEGRTVLASRLGYRITAPFVHTFCGRVFDSPNRVFDEALLRPETQDLPVFVDGIDNVVEAQRWVARRYLEDGSVEEAVPPLQALIHIMAEGHYQGKRVDHPDIRAQFAREVVLRSNWYRKRLRAKQGRDIERWHSFVNNLGMFIERDTHADEIDRLRIDSRLQRARARLQEVGSEAHLQSLFGTLGAQPLGG